MKCRNCDIQMYRKTNGINYPKTYWWRCPNCGAELPRTPTVEELQERSKSKTYIKELKG